MSDETRGGEMVVQGFGQVATTRQAETAGSALAEQSKAAVQARWIMAMQRPRDIMRARELLLADCARPAFAAKAIYNKPVGKGVEGPSIRLAEAAARAMTNIYCDAATVYDDAEKRIVRVSATDLEANVTFPMDITIKKTVERNAPMPGRKIVAQRKNSRGGDVFEIEATDDEIIDRERAQLSKAMRTCLLRLIPGDILEEAIARCYEVNSGEVQRDIMGARKKMVDAFAGEGVTLAMMQEYLGHQITETTEKELVTLRGMFAALKDGETTWAEVAGTKAPAEGPRAPIVDALRAKVAALQEKPTATPFVPKPAPASLSTPRPDESGVFSVNNIATTTAKNGATHAVIYLHTAAGDSVECATFNKTDISTAERARGEGERVVVTMKTKEKDGKTYRDLLTIATLSDPAEERSI